MAIKIDEGIPLPQGTAGAKPKYPFRRMEIGDSFLIPAGVKRERLQNAARQYARLLGATFTARKTPEGFRLWRMRSPSEDRFATDKDVPPPRPRSFRVRLPLGRMAVGDSFLVTAADNVKALAAAVSHYSKRHPGMTFTIRPTPEGERVWRLPPDYQSAASTSIGKPFGGFDIDSGVPIPPIARGGFKYPFAQLEIVIAF
jgi:hypothetical protein